MTPKQEAALRQALEALVAAYQGKDKTGQVTEAITAIREALAEQPAQQQTDERIDALRTLDYCHGLKAGWNFCAADDDAGFERAMAGTSEAVRILKTQPAQQQEPVLWLVNGVVQSSDIPADYTGCLFTSPPASKPFVGLTEDEIDFLELKYAPPIHPDFETDADHCYVLIKKTEAKLKEKNA